jgi:hypothetical protein
MCQRYQNNSPEGIPSMIFLVKHVPVIFSTLQRSCSAYNSRSACFIGMSRGLRCYTHLVTPESTRRMYGGKQHDTSGITLSNLVVYIKMLEHGAYLDELHAIKRKCMRVVPAAWIAAVYVTSKHAHSWLMPMLRWRSSC